MHTAEKLLRASTPNRRGGIAPVSPWTGTVPLCLPGLWSPPSPGICHPRHPRRSSSGTEVGHLMASASASPTSATLTIRLIRSFEHRAVKNLVLYGVDLTQTVSQLKREILSALPGETSLPPSSGNSAAALSRSSIKPTARKPTTRSSTKNDDETLILGEDAALVDCGVRNETTISFFNKQHYLDYKENPTLVW